jgi:Domain of unknown function (DUF4304)
MGADIGFLSAQDAYKVLMRDYIAPRLRELGFKGSGREFWLSSESFWAGIGFQASAWSDKSAVQFTVNVQVVEKDRWAELVASRPDRKYPQRPAANSSYSSRVAWATRIGELMDGKDHWWSTRGVVDLAALAEEVIREIRDKALPEMRSRIGGQPTRLRS